MKIKPLIGVFALFFLSTMAKGKKNMKWDIPESGAKYGPFFRDAEAKYQLPKNLIAAMAYRESRFRPEIIENWKSLPKDKNKEVGILQIIPRWHPGAAPYDPRTSIYYAAKWMRRLYNSYRKKASSDSDGWKLAIIGYNYGPGNLNDWLKSGAHDYDLPSVTRSYVDEIRQHVDL